jgi:hypothetical protein
VSHTTVFRTPTRIFLSHPSTVAPPDSNWLSTCSNRNMLANRLLLALIASAAAVHAADVCNPSDVAGPYAFQLTGSTDISGAPHPTASLGRIVFDGNGNLSGTASATFRGLLLGNPVTGTYEAKWDCSLTWMLQDDSGAFQHFSGTLSPDGARVQFQQTDPGGAQHGIMQKTPAACSASDLRPKYNFTVSGNVRAMLPGQVGHTVDAKGTLDVAQNGTFQVDGDCSVQFAWTLAPPNGQAGDASPMNMRGFLVNGGKEILAFQTDPGAMVAARLSSAAVKPAGQ